MAEPHRLRIERPHASLEAFLEADAWTVERSDMVLIGVEGVAAGASVSFEIVLASGEVVVSGEGRTVESVPAQGNRPGGLKVRFRQLGASSKAVLRRALEVQKRAGAAAPATTPQPAASGGAAPDRLAPDGPPSPERPVADAPRADEADRRPSPSGETHAEPSGVRHRAPEAVSAPGNRDALLERLRARAPRVVKVSASDRSQEPERKIAGD